MSQRKKVLLGVLSIVVLFSFLVTGIVLSVVISNYDHLGRLIKIVSLIKSDYLEKVSDTQLVDGAMKGIVDSLGDPYSVYLDPQENQQMYNMIEGQFGGVGIVLSLKDPKHLVVLKTIKNSPADKAGIEAGDIITKVDNVETSTISQDKAVNMMRGKEGSKVSITVLRPSTKQTLTFNITRAIVSVPTVEGEMLPGSKDIAYINISQFSSDTGTEMGQVLQQLLPHKPKGIILDLRYNHGGELNAAVQTASYFVPKGPVVYIVDKYGHTDVKEATGNDLGIPLVVLVNDETASAAEILSGAIKDDKTGTLIGTKTFGKGIVQTIYQLDSGAGVKITTAKYLTPAKHDINHKGIEPNIVVQLPKDQTVLQPPQSTADFDAQLQKAIEVLQTKIGSRG